MALATQNSNLRHAVWRDLPAIAAGFSLPALYYTSDAWFAHDIEVLTNDTWIMVGHESLIATPGRYFLVDFANESIIVMRASDGGLKAFYNVCRHRGSRVCLEPRGEAKRIVCPYHGWTYSTQGALIAAPDAPPGLDRQAYGLKSCHIDSMDGMIFINFCRGTPSSFEEFVGRIRPYLAPYQIKRTKVVAREIITCAANWKLVVENFAECYHCLGSHKAYCRTHQVETLMFDERVSDGASWLERIKASGRYREPLFDTDDSANYQAAFITEIGKGSVSGGMAGESVGPLLGDLQAWSGSWSAATFHPLSQMGCYDDHLMLFNFIPRTTLSTDCIVTWLVKDDAVEGVDYDTNAVAAMWRTTMAEDKTICANNQLGVGSRAYQPGPYTLSESKTAEFVRWYVRHFIDLARA